MVRTDDEASLRASALWWLGMSAVAVTALAMRLLPVLERGGLSGRGNYDDGVYYTAAAGLAHGLMPYRDFLLLHPPGILLALVPFAALARWIGEPDAFAAARVGFMIIGTFNAVLVGVVLRRHGMAAALVGASFYAVFYPAVYVEHSTMLEPLGTTCLLGAVGLISSARAASSQARSRTWIRVTLAGVLLGVSTSIKIWGAAPALAVLIWVLAALGWRRAGQLLVGFVAGATAVCLPFYLAAPAQMWHLVVLSQLGRPGSIHTWLDRAASIFGFTPFGSRQPLWVVLLAATVVVGCCLAAVQSVPGRLYVAVLAATIMMLYATPSWFQHYAGLSAGPLALVVGCAAGRVAFHLRRPVAGVVAGVVVVALLLGYANVVLAKKPFGRPFPTAALSTPVAASRTCVTTDDPISLIELNVLRRNLDRGCPLVADLGGYNYALQVGTGRFHPRARSPQWQTMALDYLGSGDTTVVGVRFHRGHGFSKATATRIQGWTRLRQAGQVSVRQPPAAMQAR